LITKLKYKPQFYACAIVVAGILFTQTAQASILNKKDNSMINALFTNIKTQCIGRYLIDVPGSFNNTLKDMIFIDSFRIDSQLLYKPAFQQRIMLREKALLDAPENKKSKSKYPASLKEVVRLPDEHGVIFDYSKLGTPDIYRKLEAHVYSGMTAFIITAKIRDFSAPKDHEKKAKYLRLGFTEAQSNTKPAMLSEMKSLISRLSGRKDEEIPTEKGVCIPNGFIKDDGGPHKEKISFTYEVNDFYFSMGTDNSYVGSDSTLLSRRVAIEEEQADAHFHTVKYGELHPNEIPAQEWLSTGMQKSNSIEGTFPIYDFTLNANEMIASPTKPWIDVGLGNTDKLTQYSESEMVEIWDGLVKTIRYRPNAF
jgi:hypothetical protein